MKNSRLPNDETGEQTRHVTHFMKDIVIRLFSFIVVLVIAFLKAKSVQDRGDSFRLLPKIKIQTLLGDDDEKG
jgi:hypothetical protein